MTCPQFIVNALAVRTAAHLLHLSSKSYAQHVALGEFYDALLTLTDRYAEVFMGLEGQVHTWPAPASLGAHTPVSLLEEFLELVEEEQGDDSESEALKNILAELEELTAQSLYKLRFLK